MKAGVHTMGVLERIAYFLIFIEASRYDRVSAIFTICPDASAISTVFRQQQ
jgi:hypothetical protein